MRWALQGYGAFPLSRRGRGVQGLCWVQELLQREQAVALFPEGTRSPEGLQRPPPGVARLHLSARAPILPVAITGTEHIRSIPRILLPTAEITVRIGSPFALPATGERPGRERRRELGDMMMRRIAELLPSAYRGRYR